MRQSERSPSGHSCSSSRRGFGYQGLPRSSLGAQLLELIKGRRDGGVRLAYTEQPEGVAACGALCGEIRLRDIRKQEALLPRLAHIGFLSLSVG